MRGTRHFRQGKPTCREGVAAIEFALILPVLLTLILGAVDFGRCFYTYIAVTNAARAGGAYAVMNPYVTSQTSTWKTQVETVARDEMDLQTGYVRGNLTVTTTTVIEASGLRRIRVEAAYPFQTLISWPGIPSSVTLRRAIEMYAIR